MYVLYSPPCLGKTTLVKSGLLPGFIDTDAYHAKKLGSVSGYRKFRLSASKEEIAAYDDCMIKALTDEGYVGVVTNMPSLVRKYPETSFAVVVKPGTYVPRIMSSDRSDLIDRRSVEELSSWGRDAWRVSFEARARYELKKGEWLSDAVAFFVSLIGLNFERFGSSTHESSNQTVR